MLRWLFNRASGLPNTSEYFPSEISFTCSLVQSAPTEAADIPQATKEATWSFIRATSGTTTKQTEHTSSLSPCSKYSKHREQLHKSSFFLILLAPKEIRLFHCSNPRLLSFDVHEHLCTVLFATHKRLRP